MNAPTARRRLPRDRTAESAFVEGLTAPQREILLLIAGHLTTHGRPPTFRWMMERTGILSPNGMMCHVRALVKKGVIRRDRGRSAGIRVCGLRLRLDCDETPAGRRLARLLGRAETETFEQGGGI